MERSRFAASTRDEVIARSSGAIEHVEELTCERVFGPDLGRSCPCGWTRHLDHEGASCDRCGERVDVDLRADRWAHVELAVAVEHPAGGVIEALPILPPAMRSRSLERAYARLLDANRRARTQPERGARALARAVRRVFATIRRQHRARLSAPRAIDFSAGGPVVGDPRIAPGACGMPDSLVETLRPRGWVMLARERVEMPRDLVGLAVVRGEGEVIRVHPELAARLGEHVRVFVPHGEYAAAELARRLSPPVAAPTGEALLGLALLTRVEPRDEGHARVFSRLERVEEAWARDELAMDDTISVRVSGTRVRTTVGRARVEHRLPPGLAERARARMDQRLIARIVEDCGAQREEVAVSLWALGLEIATREGVSFAIDDFASPAEKDALVGEALQRVEHVAREYAEGLITDGERYNASIDAWSDAAARVAERAFASATSLVRATIEAGAGPTRDVWGRGIGMTGCVMLPGRSIGELPIVRGLAEGLAPLELFASASMARSHAVDTRARQQHAATVRAKLLRAIGATEIVADDCGTERGLRVRALLEDHVVLATVGQRTRGLVVLEDVRDERTGVLVVARGARVDRDASERIDAAAVESVRVRWPLDCEARGGVCRRCAGDAEGRVGARAAFELASELDRLRVRWVTIGSGHADGSTWARYASRVEHVGIDADAVDGGWRVITPGGRVALVTASGEVTLHAAEPGDVIRVAHGANVDAHACVIARESRWERIALAAIPEGEDGIVHFERLTPDDLRPEHDPLTNQTVRIVWDDARWPALVIVPARADASWAAQRVHLTSGTRLEVGEGALVSRGQCLARTPVGPAGGGRWMQGIASVEELFEGAQSESIAPIAPCDGRFGLDASSGETWLDPSEGARVVLGRIAPPRELSVRPGEWVARGTALTWSGARSHHDLLRVMGERWLAEHLAEAIEYPYAFWGLRAPLRDIGLVVRAMLSRVRVLEPGARVGAIVPRDELAGTGARFEPVLTGISELARGVRASVLVAALEVAL